MAGRYTVVALLFLAGCTTTSAGRSGPVAWEAVDSTVQGGGSKAIHSFTLVLREREGRSLTFHRKLTFLGGARTLMSEERVFSVDFFADNQTCRNEMDSRNDEQLARGGAEKRATFICLPDSSLGEKANPSIVE